ncbi:N-acetyl-1-D-myo-inositol-2-amino-2-deoxy-alpha-D-glucopyranoside deacetylase [Sanguibacter gelidistatuariae]|uniref:N-acetyl-1-D-myo-inositol-2-amino-2-deoxy-alpha-D-glucopyranoside deacetylase n=1 Tax=Sanguibacter gelidistatuariae TaxID=1814289 RepID=A0A1G6MDL2_9MICO|nr:PIG-L family deacetylase [Sanguibacter gelidistatuariae]SDC53662.1 N-acetyl-1-D-myo-inositol-2-amino-2-deoxy-alpha-D-glucopyranoside deacetylase [Sanguibacter gelidistatuariae]
MITEASLPAGPLLAVHAHPDDETLATGALLATWAASGQPVTLVTCTRGERGEVIGATLAHLEGNGPALAAHREGELRAALAALGVRDHHYLDQLRRDQLRLEDSGMAWVGAAGGQAGEADDAGERALVAAPLEEVATALAELIRDRRPAVVVTYEAGGGYGHPDHVRAHEITMRALQLAAHASATRPAHVPDDVWWAVIPAPVVRGARAALRELSLRDPELAGLLAGSATAELPGDALPAAAAPGLPVVAMIDGAPVADRVEAALRAHATQVHWIHRLAAGSGAGVGLAGWYALSNDVLVPWLTHEHYARARGAHAR